MKRIAGAWCVVWLGLAGGAGVTAQQTVYQSDPVTVTATIEAIDKANQVVTLKAPKGPIEVKATPQTQGFNSLRVGDLVTATYFEAIAIQLRRPGDPPPGQPTTIVRRQDHKPGSETMRDQTFRATVEAIDPAAPSLTVTGAEGRRTIKVTDAAQLKAIKVGDTLDVRFYESFLVNVSRPPKKD